MPQHPNADGSTDGVKVEPWGKFVSHQLGLSVAAVAQLTVPARAATKPSCRRMAAGRSRALRARRHHADNYAWFFDPRWPVDHFERG